MTALTPLIYTGQNPFSIYNISRPAKVKTLKAKRLYTIKTSDTTFFYRRLIAFTDSSIVTTKRVKAQDSIMRITRYPNPSSNDTNYFRVWKEDTFHIAFRDIEYLERDLFTSRNWLEPFSYFAIGGVLAVAVSPIVAIAEGPQDGLLSLKIGGAFLGVTAPIIFIGTRKIKYDMRTKWRFNRS